MKTHSNYVINLINDLKEKENVLLKQYNDLFSRTYPSLGKGEYHPENEKDLFELHTKLKRVSKDLRILKRSVSVFKRYE